MPRVFYGITCHVEAPAGRVSIHGAGGEALMRNDPWPFPLSLHFPKPKHPETRSVGCPVVLYGDSESPSFLQYLSTHTQEREFFLQHKGQYWLIKVDHGNPIIIASHILASHVTWRGDTGKIVLVLKRQLMIYYSCLDILYLDVISKAVVVIL